MPCCCSYGKQRGPRTGREPTDFSASAIRRYALAARSVVWLIGVVGCAVRAPPVIAPLDVRGAATRPGRRRLVHGSADDGPGNEGCRGKPPAIILTIPGAAIPVAPVAAPIGAIAAVLEPVAAAIPATIAPVIAITAILHVRRIGRSDRSVGNVNRCSGSGNRRADRKRKAPAHGTLRMRIVTSDSLLLSPCRSRNGTLAILFRYIMAIFARRTAYLVHRRVRGSYRCMRRVKCPILRPGRAWALP